MLSTNSGHFLASESCSTPSPRRSLPSAPPTIRGPSENSKVSVVLGFPTVLPCDVEGSPTPSITWLKDNQPIVSSPQLTYTRGGQALRLGSAQGSSAGLYTCRATNAAGTAVKHYTLSVLGTSRMRQILLAGLLALEKFERSVFLPWLQFHRRLKATP